MVINPWLMVINGDLYPMGMGYLTTINGDFSWFNNGLTMVKNGMIMGFTLWLWLTVRHGIYRWPIDIHGLPWFTMVYLKWWFSMEPDGTRIFKQVKQSEISWKTSLETCQRKKPCKIDWMFFHKHGNIGFFWTCWLSIVNTCLNLVWYSGNSKVPCKPVLGWSCEVEVAQIHPQNWSVDRVGYSWKKNIETAWNKNSTGKCWGFGKGTIVGGNTMMCQDCRWNGSANTLQNR